MLSLCIFSPIHFETTLWDLATVESQLGYYL